MNIELYNLINNLNYEILKKYKINLTIRLDEDEMTEGINITFLPEELHNMSESATEIIKYLIQNLREKGYDYKNSLRESPLYVSDDLSATYSDYNQVVYTLVKDIKV